MLKLVLSILLSLSHAQEKFCENLLLSPNAFRIHASLSDSARSAISELAELRILIDRNQHQRQLSMIGLLEQQFQSKQTKMIKAFIDLNIMDKATFDQILAAEIERLQGGLLTSSAAEQITKEDQQKRIKVFLTDGFYAILHRVEPGEFEMGEIGQQTGVSITKPFDMMAIPTTQIIWRRVAELANSRFGTKYQIDVSPSKFQGDTRPVESVSYDDVQTWLDALNELSEVGEPTIADFITDHKKGDFYRLPTEAEWEFVIRGRGDYNDIFYFGNQSSQLEDFAWFYGNANDQTHPVGQKKPLQIDSRGFYDMLGNVWEWVQDWHQDDLIGGTDPEGPDSGLFRVLRGGGWGNDTEKLHSATRDFLWTGSSRPNLGFRFVRASR